MHFHVRLRIRLLPAPQVSTLTSCAEDAPNRNKWLNFHINRHQTISADKDLRNELLTLKEWLICVINLVIQVTFKRLAEASSWELLSATIDLSITVPCKSQLTPNYIYTYAENSLKVYYERLPRFVASTTWSVPFMFYFIISVYDTVTGDTS